MQPARLVLGRTQQLSNKSGDNYDQEYVTSFEMVTTTNKESIFEQSKLKPC